MAKFKPPFPAFGSPPPDKGGNPFAKGGKFNKAKGKPVAPKTKKKSKGK
jgi:hypothetical protein